MAEQGFAGIGAWILGRNMFGPVRGPWPDDSWKGWWGDEPPYHTPVFVLTHHPRAPLQMAGGTEFHFVTDGIHAALEQAKAAAGGRDVRLGGGVSTIRQYLRAGLIDELHLAVRPVLLGSGEHSCTASTCAPWATSARSRSQANARRTCLPCASGHEAGSRSLTKGLIAELALVVLLVIAGPFVVHPLILVLLLASQSLWIRGSNWAAVGLRRPTAVHHTWLQAVVGTFILLVAIRVVIVPSAVWLAGVPIDLSQFGEPGVRASSVALAVPGMDAGGVRRGNGVPRLSDSPRLRSRRRRTFASGRNL